MKKNVKNDKNCQKSLKKSKKGSKMTVLGAPYEKTLKMVLFMGFYPLNFGVILGSKPPLLDRFWSKQGVRIVQSPKRVEKGQKSSKKAEK